MMSLLVSMANRPTVRRFFAAIAVSMLTSAAVGHAQAVEMREITVAIAADEEFRSRSNWRELLKNRLAAVSDFYEREFAIRWKVVSINEWVSDNRGTDMTGRLRELENDAPHGDADIVLGISSQPSLVKGVATTLGSYVLVVDSGEYDERRNTVIIAHEFAHLFGAWHSHDRTSLMFGAGALEFGIDEATAAVIRTMRDFDFRRGIDGIDEATVARLTAVYQENAPVGEAHPLARAYMGRGYEAYLERDYNGAVAADKVAVSLSPEWGEARRMLSKALFRAGQHEEAWTEYVAARDLGITPNWAYVREMRRALIRYVGVDPMWEDAER